MTAAGLLDEQNAVPIGFLTDLINTRSADEVRTTYSNWCRLLTGSGRSVIGLPYGNSEMIVKAVSCSSGSTEGQTYPLARSALGKAFLNRRTLLLDDLGNQDCKKCRSLHSMGLNTLLVVPIMSGERCFGVISTAFHEAKTEVASRIPTLEAIAGCLSTHLFLIEKLEELKQLSRTDSLTGALNRHRLKELSERYWSDWVDIGRPFSIVSIDLDHFKTVNDTLGHAVGDFVLQEVVKRLQTNCRSGDHVVRMGGEEFCVLLTGVSSKMAEPLVKRLYRGIKDQPFCREDNRIAVTASFGVASISFQDEGFEDCLKRSDDALYRAKSDGRNRIIFADTN